MTAPPVILETVRLILRPHSLDDFASVAALWSEPLVTRFTSGSQPSTPEESWQRLLRYHGLWPALGFGYFALTDKKAGHFLGEAGLADFHRDVTPSLEGFAEAGWALMPAAWGKGIALEAMTAILEWYASTSDARPVACMVNPENAASLRLAEKLGFRLKAQALYKGAEGLMFER